MPKLPQKPQATNLPPNMVQLPVRFDMTDNGYRLRTARPDDSTQEMADWLADPAVAFGLNGARQTMSASQMRAYIAGFDNVRKNLAVIRTIAGDRAIGLVMFDIEPRHKIGSFHMLVGSARDRAGLAGLAALRMVLKQMFTARSVEKVVMEPLSRNRGVIALCGWLGFRLEGILKQHRVDSLSGERLDQHIFGMTKLEYADWANRLRPGTFRTGKSSRP